MSEDHRVLIGASGWLHSAWSEDYYPQDLPEDWKMAYYANEFPVVLVTENEWRGVESDISDWLKDAAESLLFVCEIVLSYDDGCLSTMLEDVHAYLVQAGKLGERCAGILYRLDRRELVNAEVITALLERCPDILPCCIDFNQFEPDTKTLNVLKQHQVGWCWHGEEQASGMQRGRLAVVKVKSHGLEINRLRSILETCIAASTLQRKVVLIIEGRPPDIELLRQAKVLHELL